MADQSGFDEARRLLVRRLLDRRTAADHWQGHLASSALSTGTAILALHLAGAKVARTQRRRRSIRRRRALAGWSGIRTRDGGWGDTIRSRSNISTTAIVWAALSTVSAERGRSRCRGESRIMAAQRRGGRHAGCHSRSDSPSIRQGSDLLGPHPHRARADGEARPERGRSVAIRSAAAIRARRASAWLVSASSVAGRELCAAGVDRDRAGAPSMCAVPQPRHAVAAKWREATDACTSCARCSRKAAAIWKPRR